MPYDDLAGIDTPEGVHLDLQLAGVGSRFVAAMLDGLVQLAIVLSLVLFAGVIDDPIVAGISGLGIFAAFLAYDILFEIKASGRTLGKRWAGLRVVTTSGGPVDFRTSAVRNLLRLVDILPFGYATGMVTILATSRNQRLGDLAAGTLVVRERRASLPATPIPALSEDAIGRAATWDVSALGPEEISAVRRYLERRPWLDEAPRIAIAEELTRRLHPKVVGPPADVIPDRFLEELVAAASRRGT